MDWVAFLDENNINFVTRGPNTRKDNISVQCPWCGEDDPSTHMGISLVKEAYGCWRNPEHRGKNPAGLIAALLGCSFSQAKAIARAYSAADPETLAEALKSLNSTSEAPMAAQPHSIEVPPEFRQIKPGDRFYHYLKNRGFDSPQIVVKEYDLMSCSTGEYKDRIIIPCMQNGELIAWTGRAIQDTISAPRYKTSSGAIKTTVFNEDVIRSGGDLLFIVEGPFDAVKLDHYAQFYSAKPEVFATCTFGVNASIDQVGLLKELSHGFALMVILFDADAIEPAFQLHDWLGSKKCVIGSIPKGFKDPGELPPKAIDKLIRTYIA